MAIMILDFIDDIDIDIANWQRSISVKSQGMDWKKFIPDDITIEKIGDKEYLKKYLKDRYYDPGKIMEFKSWLEKNVKVGQIEEDLKAITGGVLSDDIKVYITTFHRAPYDLNEYSFYVIFREKSREYSITNIYHELMHFIFHEFYWKKCIDYGLEENEVSDLKEALTVILNPTLAKKGLPMDRGYSIHQDLRAKLSDLWESGEWQFGDFLKELIKRFY